MTRVTKTEREEAIASLRNFLSPGDTVYTVLRHVSRSGMYRAIDLYRIRNDVPVWLSFTAAKLLEGFDEKREACKASGCGMDMGFHLVYNLSSALFRDGFDCVGQDCPSNDHVNGDRDFSAHRHSDPGYALIHRWM